MYVLYILKKTEDEAFCISNIKFLLNKSNFVGKGMRKFVCETVYCNRKFIDVLITAHGDNVKLNIKH